MTPQFSIRSSKLNVKTINMDYISTQWIEHGQYTIAVYRNNGQNIAIPFLGKKMKKELVFTFDSHEEFEKTLLTNESFSPQLNIAS